MLNDFLQSTNLIKDEKFKDECKEADFSKDFVDKFVDNFMNIDKQNPHLKYECKILPYEESKCGKELFKCPLCHIDRIDGRKHLTDHLHQHQLQFRPCDGKHLCCLCGKELSSNSSLERHLLTHSNHRPFDCQLCGKKFTTNGNLSRHIKASHGPNFTTIPTATDLCFSKSSYEAANAQSFSLPATSHQSASFSNLNSPALPSPSLAFNIFSLPSLGLPMNTNNILVKFIEDSIKAYQHIKEPFPFLEEEILNLSTKSDHTTIIKSKVPSTGSPPDHPYSQQSNKVSTTSKRIAKKISQKYRDRRSKTNLFLDPFIQTSPATSKPKFSPRLSDNYEGPLDLSVNKLLSSMSEFNSFLSSSSDNFISPEKSECDYDEILKFKLKKNSYKDAPKLIRCPMNGCTQKFPWNSSLMRHILTHTAHKPFQCIRCSKCFSTKSNRERHMHRVHGIKVNRSRIKSSISPDKNITGILNEHIFQEFSKSSSNTEFLSEQEWIQMSSSDRKAEDISHSLLKQAGNPVIEPNPHRQLFQMKALLTI